MSNLIMRASLLPLLFLTTFFLFLFGLSRHLSFGAQVALLGGLAVGLGKIVSDGLVFAFFLLLFGHTFNLIPGVVL